MLQTAGNAGALAAAAQVADDGTRLGKNWDEGMQSGLASPAFARAGPSRRALRMAQGESVEAILDNYPQLEPANIRACLAYAHAVIANDRIEAVKVSQE